MEPSEILFVEHLGIETSKILNYKCLRSKVFPLIRDEPYYFNRLIFPNSMYFSKEKTDEQ